jgi:hypothetical protein
MNPPGVIDAGTDVWRCRHGELCHFGSVFYQQGVGN